LLVIQPPAYISNNRFLGQLLDQPVHSLRSDLKDLVVVISLDLKHKEIKVSSLVSHEIEINYKRTDSIHKLLKTLINIYICKNKRTHTQCEIYNLKCTCWFILIPTSLGAGPPFKIFKFVIHKHKYWLVCYPTIWI
jgi:uncharacterized protein (DUF111 family)